MLIVIVACSTKKEDVTDLSTIIPQSKRDYSDTADANLNLDSTIQIKNQFVNNGISVDSLTLIETKLFPDRMSPLNAEKYLIHDKENTYEYHQWIFKDSSQTINAFYNWIDVFKVERIGDEVNFQKEPMYMLVGDSALIYISGNNLKVDIWLDYYKSIGFDENWNYLIEQKLGARARWFIFEDGKKVRFKKEKP